MKITDKRTLVEKVLEELKGKSVVAYELKGFDQREPEAAESVYHTEWYGFERIGDTNVNIYLGSGYDKYSVGKFDTATAKLYIKASEKYRKLGQLFEKALGKEIEVVLESRL